MVEIHKLPPDEPSGGLAPVLASTVSEVDALRAEVRGLTTLVRSVLSERDVAPMPSREELEKRAPMLEPIADERKRFEAAWAAEPRVTIMIAPTADDERIRNDARARLKQPDADYLPRTHQINGIQMHIPVGQMYSVPLSIAAKIEYESNPLRARGITAPITFDQAEQRLGFA